MKKSLIELSKEIDAYFKPLDAHIAEIEPSRGAFMLPLVATVGAIEAIGFFKVMQGSFPLPDALYAHAAIVACLALSAWFLYRIKGDSRFPVMLTLVVLATGPFGAAGVMLAILFNLGSRPSFRSFDEFFESLSPSIQKTRSQAIYEDIMSGRDDAAEQHSVIPFLDVISFGSEVQKRQALAKMTNHYQPDFAPIFRKALNDPSNMIRVQAATAISRVESQFLKRMNKLSVRKMLEESDPRMLKAVAEHYDNYAYTGLLDKDNENLNRGKALELYKRYLELKPDDHEVYVKIGRIMMRNGDHNAACDWFGKFIESAPQSVPHAIADWYSQSLFAAGRYAELRRFRALQPKVASRDDLHIPALREAFELWEGRAHAGS